MTGGFYAFQATPDLMVITLNGIYPFTNNYVQNSNGTNLMFEWLNNTLQANPNMKFMTQVHVFFGYNYWRGEEIFWYENFTNTLMEIVEPFQHNHVISIGAHIHHINVVAPLSSTVPNAKLVQIIMPAVSPVYYNNPGFGMMTFDDDNSKIDKFEFVFMLLENYHRFGAFTYEMYEPAKHGGFNLNDP